MSIQNFKVSINGDDNGMTKRHITFEMIVKHIKQMGLEDNVTRAVINKARTIPPGSLPHFIDKINTYIANLTRETTHDKQT